MVENEIIQKGEMLETTVHETFFDVLIRFWREALPQHDAIVEKIRKLNLNI